MESREAIENHIIFKTIVKWLKIGFSWVSPKKFRKPEKFRKTQKVQNTLKVPKTLNVPKT